MTLPKQSPTDYEAAAKEAYEQYHKSIFPTEEHFLDHMFFVNGNGCEWEDGALVNIFWEPPDPKKEEKRAKDHDDLLKIKKYLGEDTSYYYYSFDEWRTAHKESYIYPLCEYADAVNVPDNVRPDWLAALKRALDWADTAPHHQYRDRNGRYFDPPQTCEDTDHRWLAKIRKRVAQIERRREVDNAKI